MRALCLALFDIDLVRVVVWTVAGWKLQDIARKQHSNNSILMTFFLSSSLSLRLTSSFLAHSTLLAVPQVSPVWLF